MNFLAVITDFIFIYSPISDASSRHLGINRKIHLDSNSLSRNSSINGKILKKKGENFCRNRFAKFYCLDRNRKSVDRTQHITCFFTKEKLLLHKRNYFSALIRLGVVRSGHGTCLVTATSRRCETRAFCACHRCFQLPFTVFSLSLTATNWPLQFSFCEEMEPAQERRVLRTYANSKGSDEPANPPRLTGAYAQSHQSIEVSAWHGVTGWNLPGGEILPEPKRCFIAKSLSRSPFHSLEMTEILLKGRKNANLSIHYRPTLRSLTQYRVLEETSDEKSHL